MQTNNNTATFWKVLKKVLKKQIANLMLVDQENISAFVSVHSQSKTITKYTKILLPKDGHFKWLCQKWVILLIFPF